MTIIATMETLEGLPEGTRILIGTGTGVQQWHRTAGGVQPVDGPAADVPLHLMRGYVDEGRITRDEYREPRVGDMYVPDRVRTATQLYLITRVESDQSWYRSYRRGTFETDGSAAISTWGQQGRMRRLVQVPENLTSAALLNDVYGMWQQSITPDPSDAAVEEAARERVTVTVTVSGESQIRGHYPGITPETQAWIITYTYRVWGKPEQCQCHTLDQDKVAAGVPEQAIRWEASASCPYG